MTGTLLPRARRFWIVGATVAGVVLLVAAHGRRGARPTLPANARSRKAAVEQDPAARLAAAPATDRPTQTETRSAPASGAGFTVYFFYQRASKACEVAAAQLEKAAAAAMPPPKTVRVDLVSEAGRPLAEKYQIPQAPFVLVVAGNGAVTGGFPGAPTPSELANSLVSPAAAEVLLGLNRQQVVFVCAQSDAQPGGEETWRAAQLVGKVLPQSVHVVRFDPGKPSERPLCLQLGVSPAAPAAVTVVLSPDGTTVQRFTGLVTKRQLLASFQRVLAGRSGCGGSNADPLARDCEM